MVIMQQPPEITVAYLFTEHLAKGPRLMEMILERGNMFKALARVRGNKGAPGIDKMTLDQLPGYLKRHWPKIREDLLNGRYKPSPVRRKEIPKPGGGVRLLGIPTVLDRLIQQAIAQVLQEIWDPSFSNSSFGFRPGKSQHKAIFRARHHLASGYGYTVDMDLSKFFDRVNHDRLMSRLAIKTKDKRVLKLIRKYLTAGTMISGVVTFSTEGTPQGGPLSPLLSNIVLDELDKELERRELRFVRYADDFVIYLKSKRAAQRVMESIKRFITVKLKLKVNEEKSTVGNAWRSKFLGFSFFQIDGQPKIRIHKKAINRFKERIRELAHRSSGKSLSQVIYNLNLYLKGWWNYYGLTEGRAKFRSLNGWILRRLRCLLWTQWKNPRTRVRNLLKLGISRRDAFLCGNARKKMWHMSRIKWVIIALPNKYFLDRGLFLPGNQPA